MKNVSPAASNQRLADRMMADGHLTADGHATVLAFVGVHGGRVEDAMIENELFSEADLLRYVSTAHNTRFVSTEKLYKAALDPKILTLIPRKLADQHCVLPVMYDDVARTLSVVTPDPDNLGAMHEVKIASGARAVNALVGRPAAVRAAIQRAYHSDSSAFAQLMRGDKLVLALDRFQSGQSQPTGPFPFTPSHDTVLSVTHEPHQPQRDAHAARGVLTVSAKPTTIPPLAPQPGPPPPPRRPPPAPPRGGSAGAQPTATSRPQASDAPALPPPVALTSDYVETLNVLVSLLENARPDLRGHSAQVARVMKKVCDRMGLQPMQTAACVVAAYIHDLGKAGTYHLTALNVAEYDGHRTAALKVYNVPERFLEAVALHPDTRSAVNSMYERFDGKGFPAGTSGKDIPLGARILAVVDSYSDVTTNPRNPARRLLKPAEAMEFLSKYRGSVFDPTVLDLVKAEVAGEDLRAKLLADRHNLLLVDPDPEESTVLELRLLEAGFDVRIARSYQQAVHELKAREVHVVVSEVDLDSEDAGLTLRTAATSEPWGQSVAAWVIHTRKADRQLAEIVFDLGIDDLVSKPTPAELFVTKLRQLLERKRTRNEVPAAVRGVNGSLAEMGLPDVVQILWHGRKTCIVRLKTKSGNGDIGFSEGQIVDARFGSKRGEEAFYAMLNAREGDFQIDPEKPPGERTIDASPEGLLLEGMRRMDEGLL